MSSFIVLGGGLVGSVMAFDLKKSMPDAKVTVADRDVVLEKVLSARGIGFIELDFSDLSRVAEVVKPFDIVVGAVPGFLGYRVMKTVIEQNKPMADISFAPEDCRELHSLAVERGVPVLYDIGVAPGISNILFAKSVKMMDHVISADCYVGGLPQKVEDDYKATFSPVDVIEEYTRPARVKKDGKVVIIDDPIADPEKITVQGMDLEAFVSDGCRSLLDLPIDNMSECTLRHPGHLGRMGKLRDEGKFAPERRAELNDTLFKDWIAGPDFRDFICMRVDAIGTKDGKPMHVVWEILDKYDEENGNSAMSRTTGFTCSVAAQMLAKKMWTEPGVFPSEAVPQNEKCYEYLYKYLRDERGIIIHEKLVE